MPRKQRMEAPGAIHHVIARGNGDNAIALDDHDRRALLAQLARAAELCRWSLHAYCLMDTHFHAVIGTPEPTLGYGMQRVIGRYAYAFNRRRGRSGHLFAGPFSSSVIDSDSYALEASAYVVLNPVRAALVRAPEDWKWSSYRASAGLISVPAFLQTTLVPGMLHLRPERAQVLYRQLVHEIAERPRPGSG